MFELVKSSPNSKARAGVFHTAHGSIETPVFMPVGTQASVKAMTVPALKEIGTQIILSNLYHLTVRPGIELIQACGGLHQFMQWDQPILTDSGGFQVFSLKGMRKVTEEGVAFKSHLDGSPHLFTPKSVVDSQLALGSDIMMPLDVCTPYPASEAQVEADLIRTTKWETEAKRYWEKKDTQQHLFAITQGGMYKHLREKSSKALVDLDFPGYAIGGLSVGEPKPILHEMTAFCADLLPENKPRYLMGVGTPEELKQAIHAGVDMFDCVAPSRLARHGQVFTSEGSISIKKQEYKLDMSGLDPSCQCQVCQTYSRAYIRHLFMAKEILASILMTTHNLYFLIHLAKKIREEILQSV